METKRGDAGPRSGIDSILLLDIHLLLVANQDCSQPFPDRIFVDSHGGSVRLEYDHVPDLVPR